MIIIELFESLAIEVTLIFSDFGNDFGFESALPHLLLLSF